MTTVRKSTKRDNKDILLKFEQRKGYYTALGYRSARVAAGEGRSYSLQSSQANEEKDRKKLIGQSRDFMRNNPIYKGMINRAVGYIVGNGYELQVRTGSANINKKIENLWKDFWKKPEIRNLRTGAKVVRAVCKDVMVAGDVTCLKTNKGVIQLFEAEQVAGEKYNDPGIKTDKYDRPTAFNLCPWNMYSVSTTRSTWVDAANVFYVVNLDERISQLRGVPAAQSSFSMLHRISDTCDSEAIAWQLLSRLAVSITQTNAEKEAFKISKADPNKTGTDTSGHATDRVTLYDYAMIFHGEIGDEIKGIERNIPGMNFTESLRTFLRLLGLPIGLPLEIILLDWTQSNYSQSRAVLEQAYMTFIDWQELIENSFYNPIFEWKLSKWIEQGLIGKRKDIEYDWIKPAYPWLDQLKEALAWSTQVERGFVTHSQVCKSLNTDRAEVIERRDLEVRDAIERSKKIEEQTGVAVPWEIFAGLKPQANKGTLAKPADTAEVKE